VTSGHLQRKHADVGDMRECDRVDFGRGQRL
jgi:hypothetical protein